MHAPLALVSALNPHNAPVQFRGALSDLKRSKIHQHKLVVLNLFESAFSALFNNFLISTCI